MGSEDYKKFDVYEKEITVDTNAYQAGDLVGSVIQILDFDDFKPVSGRIVSAAIVDQNDQQANMDLLFLSNSCTEAATTITNNAAIDLKTADAKKVFDSCHLTDHVDMGTTCISSSGTLNKAFRLRSATGIYVAPIARAARTQTSVSALLLKLGIEQD